MAEPQRSAHSGNWYDFIKLCGVPNIECKDLIVSVAKKWSDKPNRYQEPTGYQIIGINYGKIVITT